ncbi:MAG: hypothetical protein H6925_01290 [Holosporaceae bacterium]|nr:MAG: hypothetical protein H6925_01290 [Holosporaceae bacterium]
MIKSERYEEIVKIFNISEGGNVPRLSGSFDGGMVATYLGFGDTLIPTPGMNRENLTEEYKSGFWAKATRDKKLRSGRVQLSQHFENQIVFMHGLI